MTIGGGMVSKANFDKMGERECCEIFVTVYLFSRHLLWLHNGFYVSRFYVEGRGTIDIESVDCGK